MLLAGCTTEAEVPDDVPALVPSEVAEEEVSLPTPDSPMSGWSVSDADFDQAIQSTLSVEYDEFDEKTQYLWGGFDFVDSVTFSGGINVYDSGKPALSTIGVAYFDEDWIFFDNLDVRAGGTTYQVDTFQNLVNKGTDVHSGGYVSEIGIVEIGAEKEAALEAILADPDAKFRLVGSSGSVERAFTDEERDLFRAVYNVYQGLKQGLDPR